jgi:hypothetical protein
MRAAIVALTTVVALVTSVMAQPRKILVLPLDGNAPAAQRMKLNREVARLAHALGNVTVGDTTFNETAAAVGCSPTADGCAETVRTTLAVDELVYGTATTAGGSTTITVRRAIGSGEPRSQVTIIGQTDDGAQVTASLQPLFAGSNGDKPIGEPDGGDTVVGRDPPIEPQPEGPRRTFFDTKERKLGVALGASGVIALVIGFSLWAGSSSLQDRIDTHPTMTRAQIDDLRALEDRAADKALQGNLFVLVGLAAGGIGGYLLYKDRQSRNATVAPAPAEQGTGMTLVLRGSW